MALSQIVWALDKKAPLPPSALQSEKELEDLLYEHIELLDDSWIVIGRQVHTKNGKFVDLLCMDHDGDMVVIELKKNMTPREVTAQVIDYASHIAQLSAKEIGQIYLEQTADAQTLNDAYQNKFNQSLDDEQINEKVKMIIVASQMDDSTEHIIQYLRDTYQVDINILFFNVFIHEGVRLLSRAWFKEDMENAPAQEAVNESWNGEYYVSFGEDERNWSDARELGFISAGGGHWYSDKLKMLDVDDRVWVNIPHVGYVGVGYVTDTVKQANEVTFDIDGQAKTLAEIKTNGDYLYNRDDVQQAEYIVKIQWIKTVPKQEAVSEVGFFGNQNIVCRPKKEKWDYTVQRLKKRWNLTE